MNKERMINEIEMLINAEKETFDLDFNSEVEGSVGSFMYQTAFRLINNYTKYIQGENGISDVLVAIRNFMLVFQTQLRIDQIEIPSPNEFGLYIDNQSGKYFAAYDIPKYVKFDSFIKDGFITENTQEQKILSKYCLNTNNFIHRITGFTKFKSMEQKLCVYGALNAQPGYTTLISMPTGGGKSLVTQVLSYEKKGLTIVVVPTVSLAIDQERAAKKNIKTAAEGEIFCYYSGVKNFDEIISAIKKQTIRLLFISPEALLRNETFNELISEANKTKYMKNIIIDEAHIVASWGDFFRVDYQCLEPWRKELLQNNSQIRTFLLSATFSDETVRTLKKMFSEDGKWIEIRCDSLRKEPRYLYVEADSDFDKQKKVLRLINDLPRPTVIYVNSPFEAKRWKGILNHHEYDNIHMFTGETKSSERKELIDRWVNNDFDLMIATSAFGVGVDKPDVRSVLHLYVPETPDSYYQELGRGGRDGLPCLSVMCINQNDITTGAKHVTKVLTTETFWGRWWSMYTNPQNMWDKGRITIQASTKPNYNRTDYFEEGNDADEKWNINVLLLLNRYDQIQITGLDLDQSNRYIFTIKILNELIAQDCKESKLLFQKIRDKEAQKAQTAYNRLKMTINKRDVVCWSEMFAETYPLVSEYCAGCNAHKETEFDELDRFPLLAPVRAPKKPLSEKMVAFFGETRGALILRKDSVESYIEEYQPDVVISQQDLEIDLVSKPGMNNMNFMEFTELQARDNGFYTSGLIMIIYSESDDENRKNFQKINRYLEKDKHAIHVSSTDFIVSKSNGKCISDYINGTVIRE